ncbi:MAG TPA: MFS transporter [Mucilaginibacter sp.]|nr:MFS transporter [Mucilaginibacter sp.]
MDTETAPVLSPRRMRIANAVFFFISGFGYTTWTSRIPDLKLQLHLDKAQLGAALFALPIGLFVTIPFTTRLLTIFSSNRIMVIGAIAFNVMLALVGYSSLYWQFIVILFFFGSSRNLLNLATNTQSVSVQKFYQKSIITTFHGIWSLSGLAGVFASWILTFLGVPTYWHLLSVGILMSVLAIIALPNTLYQKPEPRKEEPTFSFRKRILILQDKDLFKFAMICFATMACENVMYDWSGIYVREAVHANEKIVTTGLLVFMISVAAGRFIGDRITGRLGIRRLLVNSSVLIVAGFTIAILLPHVVTALIGFSLVGFGVSCIVPLVYSMAGKSKTLSEGPAIAAVSSVGYLGFLFVPPFVGFVAQAVNLQLAFSIIALFGFLILWMTTKINEGKN